ncbi:MAG: hypothetical protein MUC92_01275 [Fimbriimonadaceae bacterium]|jgi:hypothetical protein|nr:hypothetical protein [Fimbriimonadaceae bacterium]
MQLSHFAPAAACLGVVLAGAGLAIPQVPMGRSGQGSSPSIASEFDPDGESARRPTVLSQTVAFGLRMEEVVAENVAAFQMTPDGSKILFSKVMNPGAVTSLREPQSIQPEIRYFIYNAATRRTSLLPYDFPRYQISIIPLPDTAVITLTREDGEVSARLLDLNTLQLSPLPDPLSDPRTIYSSSITFSRFEKIWSRVQPGEKDTILTVSRLDGSLVAQNRINHLGAEVAFQEPGKAIVTGYRRGGEQTFYLWDLKTASLTILDPKSLEGPLVDRLHFYTTDAQTELDGSRDKGSALWLVSTMAPSGLDRQTVQYNRNFATTLDGQGLDYQPPVIAKEDKAYSRTLLGYDLKPGAITQNSSTLYYMRNQVLYRQDIERMSLEAFRQLEVERTKLLATSAAKQVAVAVLIYASDYDDKLPLNDGKFADAVMPYIRSRDLLSGFDYVFPGGGFPEGPSKVIMGTITTRYGRAIAYLDGSVRWEPNP